MVWRVMQGPSWGGDGVVVAEESGEWDEGMSLAEDEHIGLIPETGQCVSGDLDRCVVAAREGLILLDVDVLAAIRAGVRSDGERRDLDHDQVPIFV